MLVRTMGTIQCMVVCVFLISVIETKPKRYDGYEVISAKLETTHHINVIQGLWKDKQIDFWTDKIAIGHQVTLMVPPQVVKRVRFSFVTSGIRYKIVNHNIQIKISKERARLSKRYKQPGQFAFNINDFNTLDDIYTQLKNWVSNCPNGISCSLSSVGNSSEGRQLNQLKISTGTGRPAIWLDSNIHAREWLSSASVLKITNHFLSNYSTDATVKHLLDTYDWYVLPVMNPDGYQFTWTEERYWRKSRNENDDGPLGCRGVDLNRNYDHMWGSSGTSSDPCSDNYGGRSASSEPETQAIQSRIAELASNLRLLVTVHTYGQYWLMPYGHAVDDVCARAPDHDDLLRVASAAADATENTHGTVWTRGTFCEALYPASGTTQDYAKSAQGIQYAYTPELRGNDFVVDADQIQPSFQELWNGLVAMINAIENP